MGARRSSAMLNHDLVLVNPNIARYVNVIERQNQSIKEDLPKRLCQLWANILEMTMKNEVTYASFNNKEKEIVDKRFKGYGG